MVVIIVYTDTKDIARVIKCGSDEARFHQATNRIILSDEVYNQFNGDALKNFVKNIP